MSKPSKEQIQAYELQHKALFCSLVIANNLWLKMPGQYGFNPKDRNTNKYKEWEKLMFVIADKLRNWSTRQQELEKSGGVPKVPAKYYGLFFKPQNAVELSNFAKSFIKPGSSDGIKGIGFIILIIWAVILLAAFFTAAYIVDKTNVTVKDREDLLKQTEETAKRLGLSPAQTAALITSTQQSATPPSGGMFSGLLPKVGLGLGLAAFFLFKQFTKPKTA